MRALSRRIYGNIKNYFEVDYYFKPLNPDYKGKFLYPIDFSYWINCGHYKLTDKDGIPQEQYRQFGIKYNWPKICSFALYHFNLLANNPGNIRSKEIFFKMADFLVGVAVVKGEKAYWYYDMPWNGLQKNWVSAIAQGEIISVLVRAYKLSENTEYLLLAEKSFNLLITPIEDGGLLTFYNDSQDIVLEEHPDSKVNPLSHILNGYLIAAIGIYELDFILSNNSTTRTILDKIFSSLDKHIEGYLVKSKRWTLYAYPYQKQNYATPVYEALHISLIQTLYAITLNSKFKAIVDKLEDNYLNKFLRLQAFLKKIVYRLQVSNDM